MIVKPRPRVKTQGAINAEWDRLAPVRHRQIITHLDSTYHDVLVPTVLSLCAHEIRQAKVLDVGCGTGHLALKLSKVARLVRGVDPSAGSLEIAKKVTAAAPNVKLFLGTIEEFCEITKSSYDVAVANMTLMDCLYIDDVFSAISRLLRPNAPLVCTITHPWHWPVYWNYNDEPWFDYTREIMIEAPFRITAQSTKLVTTHVHRSLAHYMSSLAEYGFVIEQLIEPMPTNPVIQPWRFPRYLAFRASRTRGHRALTR